MSPSVAPTDGAQREILGDRMRTSRRHLPRRSVVALALSLIGVLFLVPSASAHGGNVQHFLGLSTDPSDSAMPVIIANGPIHARGVDHVISDTKDRFQFAKGAIFVTHKPSGSSSSSDPKTCLQRYKESGRYWVTGGAGAYADATGHGHYLVTVTAVGCSQNNPPKVFMLTIRAAGPLTF
jgi:hypothetical protein